MSDMQIISQNQETEENFTPSRRDYTMSLLNYGAMSGSIPAERLADIRLALQKAASERAAAYTNGRSLSVTRKQAEAFYQSVFCQLDAVLLELGSDSLALSALCNEDFNQLLEAGLLRTLQLYEQAKEDFRAAYRMTEPFATSFFKELLHSFENFCTKYDARFRAFDTKVEFVYPILDSMPIAENGIIGTAKYFHFLRLEGEFLQYLNAEDFQDMLVKYAKKYRTQPEMIAENLPELALRHLMINAVAGESGCCVTAENAEAAGNLCASLTTDAICSMTEAVLPAVSAETKEYFLMQLPRFAEILQKRAEEHTLSGWLAVTQ